MLNEPMELMTTTQNLFTQHNTTDVFIVLENKSFLKFEFTVKNESTKLSKILIKLPRKVWFHGSEITDKEKTKN